MKLFVAALATETNSFSPFPTGMGGFDELGIRRGPQRDADPAAICLMLNAIRGLALGDGNEVVEGLCAAAHPQGPVLRETYESLRDELLWDLEVASPVDAVELILHGAMIAHGYDDCEGDIVARAREIVGDDVPIGVMLDPHCHLTERLMRHANIVVAFKHYPHTDTAARAAEVYRLIRDTVQGRIRPVMAVHDCRIVGLWPTTQEPMATFVGRMQELEGKDGILSVSFGHGFPWGDVAEAGTKCWVITDGDVERARNVASMLGEEVWAMRHASQLQGLSVEHALDRIVAATDGPLVLADRADNPGGGAPGDNTVILRRLIGRGIGNVAIGVLWDPHAVAICRNAGVGAQLTLRIGGKSGVTSGDPIDVPVTVRGVAEAHTQSVFGSIMSFGAAAWVSTPDGIDIALASQRLQVIEPAAFEELGIGLASKRAIVVKSAQHFRAAFAGIATEMLWVDAPGALSHEFARLPYVKRDLKYWPRVDDPFELSGS